MRRQEAVEVMDKIGASCKLLNPRGISLEESDKAGRYEIHIKSDIDDDSWECLKGLAKKYNFSLKLMNHTLIVYRSLDQNNCGIV